MERNKAMVRHSVPQRTKVQMSLLRCAKAGAKHLTSPAAKAGRRRGVGVEAALMPPQPQHDIQLCVMREL